MRGSAGATCGWASGLLGRHGEGEEPTWAGAEKRALGFGPTGEGKEERRPRKEMGHAGGMTTARNRKEKGDLFFLLLFF